MRFLGLFVCGVTLTLGCGGDSPKPDPALETTLDSQPPTLTNQPLATFTFHSDPAGDQFVCVLDGGDPVQCHSPFAQSVGEGAHAFSVATLGAHATLDPTPAVAAWTVDLTPPDTTITSAPPAVDNTVAPTFEFTGTDPNSAVVTFECALDGDPFTACPEPEQITVTDGIHDFQVRARDLAGNVDPTPAKHDWTVDSSTPDTMITAGPAASSTTGTATSFSFASPVAGATFECQLDAAAFASCPTPLALTGLAGGAHSFAVRAKDVHDVVDPTPAMRAWTVDATPPDVTITQEPADPSNDATPTFGFSSTDATATFACAIDGATAVACTSPWTSAALLDGAHTYDVRATDPYGNFADATYTWTQDTVAPTVTITGGPQDPPGTKNSSPSFTFTTAGSPVLVECSLDGGAFATCSSPVAFSSLPDATHVLLVRATDAAGNQGSAMRTFTVDTTAPVVTITPPSSPTNDATPTWAFAVAGGPATTTCQIDSGAQVACTSPFTSGALADGSHMLTVRATDGVGNTGSASSTIVVDTVAPTVTITSGPADPTPTSTAAPSFGFTVGGGPAATTCKVDGGAAASCTSPFTTAMLADGGHTLTIVATDTAGNTGQATRAFTVDTTPPTVTITSGPQDPTPVNDKTPTFDFTVAGGPAPTTCKVDGGAAASCTSPVTTASLADGGHTLTVTATDAAGNTGSATRTFTIDTAPPGLTIDTGPQDPTPTVDTTPTFTFTVTAGPATTTCQIDGNIAASCTSPFTSTALGQGAHVLTVVATDTAGNAATATRHFTVDTTAPNVTFTGGPQDPTPTNDPTPAFTFTITGGPVASTTCAIDGGAAVACTSPYTTPSLADGAHTIVVTATDLAGNPGSASRAFTVDTTPPVLAFDDVPPSNWPVDYYDIAFHAGEAGITFTCSLNGAAFAPCATGSTVTTTYGALTTFKVRGTDAANNATTIATTWTSQTGLVLHYPWEQASLANTSLLAQRPAYSPDGAGTPTAVGGWAGTALGSPAQHAYKQTQRPLSSSPDGGYTASLWVRTIDGGSGILWSNVDAANGGLELSLEGSTVFATLFASGGATVKTSADIKLSRWSSVAVRTTGSGKGIDLFIDGALAGSIPAGTPGNGFDAGQSKNLAVGSITGTDVDDLRFYNTALGDAEMCTTVARGTGGATGKCTALAPTIEFDFEGNYTDTGTWSMTQQAPQAAGFVNFDKLGLGLSVAAPSSFSVSGFAALAGTVPIHSISFWFQAGQPMTLFDFTYVCGAAAPVVCGMSATFNGSKQLQLDSYAGTLSPKSLAIDLDANLHGVVITEQKTATGKTAQLTVYVDGTLAGTLVLGGYDAFANPSDQVTFASEAGALEDEIEFWGADLSSDKQMLCENGFDGQYDPVSGVCILTSN